LERETLMGKGEIPAEGTFLAGGVTKWIYGGWQKGSGVDG